MLMPLEPIVRVLADAGTAPAALNPYLVTTAIALYTGTVAAGGVVIRNLWNRHVADLDRMLENGKVQSAAMSQVAAALDVSARAHEVSAPLIRELIRANNRLDSRVRELSPNDPPDFDSQASGGRGGRGPRR